ncbi:hypothetical protein SM11_pD1400 (plasmid) [Sinorhizobium meliloti SM11]|uniref:Uncharacterized protein n=1 Tax=Sinorhizobium meliloti (strain SM11) TaxID=707241 RepID=F7XIJ9_SINMM|nr:hypothetical protein SM11_pD1400 [Sinorhizobium meliloti SM11]
MSIKWRQFSQETHRSNFDCTNAEGGGRTQEAAAAIEKGSHHA